jgi:hypothetical protein
METYYDVISTIHQLQDMWCNNLEINYSWVKGHADKLDRELNTYERLNILDDEICDDIRVAATGITGQEGPAPCDCLKHAFIRGARITSHMKEILTSRLLDGDMQIYLMDKENWSRQDFDSINWRGYGTAFKRLPRSRQTAVAKASHNLWHTGGT